MLIKKIFVNIVSLIPYKLFVFLYPNMKKTKLSDIADNVYFKRFIQASSKKINGSSLLLNQKSNNQNMLIQKGLWDYRICNFCFVKDMLSNIIWCIERGYFPIVDVYPPQYTSYTAKTNLWEMFFEQPLYALRGEKAEKTNICPIVSSPIKPSFGDAYSAERIDLWHRILETFAVYNKKTQVYFDAEYESLIKGKSVVACVLRSTDYTKLQPKGHPVQPSVYEVFAKIHEVMVEYPIDYIYLATEDSRIANAFKTEFPNQILENKRHYFNEQYDDNCFEMISQVHFDRENDDYLKMLEYFSSMNLVSKCDYLVTGLSGGSEMAIYRNGNRYKYSYIFDKGFY